MSTESEQKADNIIRALGDNRWDYRTSKGIAEQTGLDMAFIDQFLNTRKDLVWKSAVPDRTGKELYTLKNRQSKIKDLLRNIRTFVSKEPS